MAHAIRCTVAVKMELRLIVVPSRKLNFKHVFVVFERFDKVEPRPGLDFQFLSDEVIVNIYPINKR